MSMYKNFINDTHIRLAITGDILDWISVFLHKMEQILVAEYNRFD